MHSRRGTLTVRITSWVLIGLALGLGRLPTAHGASCEQLLSLALPHATITAAARVAARAFSLSSARPGAATATTRGSGAASPFGDLPAFCRVSGTSKPTADSDIRFEVWLPLEGWNGKFQGVGNGGLAGAISYSALAQALSQGYAAGSTDTGHTGTSVSGEWALGHPERIVDFGHRAVHEMTVQAKAITTAFYGDAPRHSYWNGCSEGGNQALSEAQRYPQDYDGILAGAPANDWTHLQMGGNWISQAIHEDPATFVPTTAMPALHRSVLAACDALDGIHDGVIEDPRRCRVDLEALKCRSGGKPSAAEPDCLTAAQISGLAKVYGGARNRRTGELIFPGYLPGGELGWRAWIVGTDVPPRNAQHLIQEGFFKYLVFAQPEWRWQSFDFDRDVTFTDRKLAGIVNATNPDLTAFKARGGKLIQYHGWGDPAISPLSSIRYFESVQSRMGDTSGFYRLFMIPGMGHCGGGDGTDQFDKIGTLARWVEDGIPPDRILASHREAGRIVRTRPLCPYGKIARWKGSGSTDDAENFTCAAE
jgi:feruloyl esterase